MDGMGLVRVQVIDCETLAPVWQYPANSFGFSNDAVQLTLQKLPHSIALRQADGLTVGGLGGFGLFVLCIQMGFGGPVGLVLGNQIGIERIQSRQTCRRPAVLRKSASPADLRAQCGLDGDQRVI